MTNVTNDGQRDSEQPPPNSVIALEDAKPESKKHANGAQKRKHTWLECFAVFFAALAFLASGYQGWVARDTEQRTLRAYLIPEKALLGNITSDRPTYEFYAKNYGQSPAIRATVWVRWDYFDGQNNFRTRPNDTKFSQYLVGPQGFTFASDSVHLNAERKQKIAQGSAAFFLYGDIRYTDIFNRDWTTKFRFVWKRGFEPAPDSGALMVDAEGNEAE